MCKHVLNAQVKIYAPCCEKWFDCLECHTEYKPPPHRLLKRNQLIFRCKKCTKVFDKYADDFHPEDEYCPECDNHFVIEAKTPKAALTIESDDTRVNNKMLKDERKHSKLVWTIFDPDPEADKLG